MTTKDLVLLVGGSIGKDVDTDYVSFFIDKKVNVYVYVYEKTDLLPAGSGLYSPVMTKKTKLAISFNKPYKNLSCDGFQHFKREFDLDKFTDLRSIYVEVWLFCQEYDFHVELPAGYEDITNIKIAHNVESVK